LKWAWARLKISEAQAQGSSPGFDISVLACRYSIKIVSSGTKNVLGGSNVHFEGL
jgi:hypothetical protein